MLTPNLISDYGVDRFIGWTVSSMDLLFSGQYLDPEVRASDGAFIEGCRYWDIVFAVTAGGKIVTQIVEFKSRYHYEMYLEDGVVLFNDEGI